MSANEDLIKKFYFSFQQLDHEGMRACYHEDIAFSDPIFPLLKGKDAGAMWHMLITALQKNKGDWKLECSNIQVSETEGSCRWEAHYTFSLTGRKVHNIISARFIFKEGKIIQHDDFFDFYRWARMAFGMTGLLIGWTKFFKQKIKHKSKERLASFMKTSS